MVHLASQGPRNIECPSLWSMKMPNTGFPSMLVKDPFPLVSHAQLQAQSWLQGTWVWHPGRQMLTATFGDPWAVSISSPPPRVVPTAQAAPRCDEVSVVSPGMCLRPRWWLGVHVSMGMKTLQQTGSGHFGHGGCSERQGVEWRGRQGVGDGGAALPQLGPEVLSDLGPLGKSQGGPGVGGTWGKGVICTAANPLTSSSSKPVRSQR